MPQLTATRRRDGSKDPSVTQGKIPKKVVHPEVFKVLGGSYYNISGARGGSRTHTGLRPLDFESSASSGSTTLALVQYL